MAGMTTRWPAPSGGGPVPVEADGYLAPRGLAVVEDHSDSVGSGGGVAAVVEVEGEHTTGVGGPQPGLVVPLGSGFYRFAFAGHGHLDPPERMFVSDGRACRFAPSNCASRIVVDG
jgi:hypothetical protein